MKTMKLALCLKMVLEPARCMTMIRAEQKQANKSSIQRLVVNKPVKCLRQNSDTEVHAT